MSFGDLHFNSRLPAAFPEHQTLRSRVFAAYPEHQVVSRLSAAYPEDQIASRLAAAYPEYQSIASRLSAVTWPLPFFLVLWANVTVVRAYDRIGPSFGTDPSISRLPGLLASRCWQRCWYCRPVPDTTAGRFESSSSLFLSFWNGLLFQRSGSTRLTSTSFRVSKPSTNVYWHCTDVFHIRIVAPIRIGSLVLGHPPRTPAY